MGHERIGVLPKSRRWRSIVDELSIFAPNNINITEITRQTITNVKSRFKNIENDRGVQAGFKFLLLLSHATKSKNPHAFLKAQGVDLSEKVTLLQISKSVNEWVLSHSDSNEYAGIAKKAAIDALCEWHKQNRSHQKSLFISESKPFDIWKRTMTGSGFCELSRMYFSNFTEIYLKYFLEREASARIRNIYERNLFNQKLEEHVQDISKHAFEMSKIVQSFAAGWFNRNAINDIPSDKKIKGFLSIAFAKLREELLHEETK